MGEISEALERARREEARQREERRKRRESAVSDSLRQAAIDRALADEDAVDAEPASSDDLLHQVLGPEAEEKAEPERAARADFAPTPEPTPEPTQPVEAPGPRTVELHPDSPTILSATPQLVEQTRHLANRVAGELERRGLRSMAVVSALRMEGKSTVSANLALAAASLSDGRQVALVDLDLRKPSIADKLGVEPKRGVESVLQGRAELADVCVSVDRPLLDVYPALPAEVPAHELLVLPSFGQMIRQLTQRYRFVFVDTPPVLLVPDSNLILKSVESCVTVARSGVTRARAVRQMLGMLPRDRVLGSLLNSTSSRRYGSDYYTYESSDRGEDGEG